MVSLKWRLIRDTLNLKHFTTTYSQTEMMILAKAMKVIVRTSQCECMALYAHKEQEVQPKQFSLNLYNLHKFV
jgi:hypothetical protein